MLTSAQGNYGAQAGVNAVPVTPRTITSAIGRVESLNERLSGIREQLTSLADQIGGPRGVSGSAQKEPPPSSGAVGRLNDAVDCSHACASDIDDLLSSIGRSLG